MTVKGVGCNLKMIGKWYEHKQQVVTENKDYNMLQNFPIKSNHTIDAKCLDMIIEDNIGETDSMRPSTVKQHTIIEWIPKKLRNIRTQPEG